MDSDEIIYNYYLTNIYEIYKEKTFTNFYFTFCIKASAQNALSFDGSNDYASINELFLVASGTWTIETWVRPTAISRNNSFRSILGSQNGDPNTRGP